MSDQAAKRYAAIDLGSNNCRLLIAEASLTDSIEVIGSFSRSTRLGEGVKETGRLSPAAMGRARSALEVCRRKIRQLGVHTIRAVATEACRQAENAPDFLSLVRESLMIPIEIISAEEEAELAWQGCYGLVSDEATDLLVFDIGGASMQLIYATKQQGSDTQSNWQWQDWMSLERGVISLHDEIGSDALSPEHYQAQIDQIQTALMAFAKRNALQTRLNQTDRHIEIIGTSGTVTTLCGVLKGLPFYDREQVDGATLNREAAFKLMDHLAGLSVDQRQEYGCIGKDRAQLMVAGCILLKAIWQCWPIPEIRVADRGLREGMLRLMMREDGHHVQ